MFKARTGYGKGCPWTCPFGRGDVQYHSSDYPRTFEFIDSHAYLAGVHPPNTMDLMKLYVDAFGKISDSAERVLALAKEQSN